MKKYTYEVEVIHEFKEVAFETVTVEAENETEAVTLAYDLAYQQSEHDAYNAEHDISYTGIAKLIDTKDKFNTPKDQEED